MDEELAGWQQAIRLMEEAARIGKEDYVHLGNLYTDNLIGTVIGLSVADDWEGARREWEIVGCEVDENHSATCVCGKEGLRYVYTIANTETGETLSA